MSILSVACIFFCVAIALCSATTCTFYGNVVSEAEKKTIVDTHNYLRGLITEGAVPGQPKGINLKALSWDNNLAIAAQNIANTCNYAHVKVNDGRFTVGQNLAWTGESSYIQESNWVGAIQMWFDEHKDFKYPTTSNGVTGHYTQVVWADTYLIGCGYAWYRKDIWYEKLYVCNYGPAGNYVGQAPYQV